MSFRKVIFWLHLAVGIVAGLVILVMSVTGVLLAFERQITEWSERGHKVAVPAAGSPLSLETLLDRAHIAHPDPETLTLHSDPSAPVEVRYGRETTRLIDPYTGNMLGEPSKGVHDFFHSVTDIHRWLAAAGDRRDWGKAVTGACNAAFVVLVVSGLYLWFPRRWSWRFLRAVTWFQRGLGGKARDFNWHNSIGLWCAPVLFVVSLTGVLISYPWATSLLYRAAGEEPPPPRNRRERGQPEGPAVWTGLDRLWPIAQEQVPDWQTISVRLAPAESPVQFTIAAGHPGRPDLRSQLSLDPQTGEPLKWETFAGNSTGRQLRTWARWIHTGEAGGWIGQLLAGLASAGAAFLVWTGLALTWRRFFRP